jgi:hypothetical protein
MYPTAKTIAHRPHLGLTPYPLLGPEYERFGSGRRLSLSPPIATNLLYHFHMSTALSPSTAFFYFLVQLLPLCILLIIPLSLY